MAVEDKPARDDLVEKLNTSGWEIETGNKGFKIAGTLEALLRTSHARKAKGEAPGLIQEIETGLELDAIKIVELWEHLGLPT